jgi:hypothetical protein
MAYHEMYVTIIPDKRCSESCSWTQTALLDHSNGEARVTLAASTLPQQ